MNRKQSHKRKNLETSSKEVGLLQQAPGGWVSKVYWPCQGPYIESYPVLSIYQPLAVVLHICGRSQMLWLPIQSLFPYLNYTGDSSPLILQFPYCTYVLKHKQVANVGTHTLHGVVCTLMLQFTW